MVILIKCGVINCKLFHHLGKNENFLQILQILLVIRKRKYQSKARLKLYEQEQLFVIIEKTEIRINK